MYGSAEPGPEGRRVMACYTRRCGIPAVSGIRPGADGKAVSGMGTARAWCLLAPNPSPMTLDGTNTWVIAEPGSTAVLVVDPGPSDEGHLRRVLSVASAGDRRGPPVVVARRPPPHTARARPVPGACRRPAW